MADQNNFSTTEVLAVSCAIHTDLGGYLSKFDSVKLKLRDDPAYRESNSELIYKHFCQNQQITVTDQHIGMAARVSDYIKGLAFTTFQRPLSDYEKNLLITVNTHRVTTSQLGILAGMPNLYTEGIRADAWRVRESELAAKSKFFGNLGDAVDLETKLEYWKVIPRTFSTFMVVSLDEQHILKFFFSSLISESVKQAAQIQLYGNVKSHTISKHTGARITQLNQVSLSY